MWREAAILSACPKPTREVEHSRGTKARAFISTWGHRFGVGHCILPQPVAQGRRGDAEVVGELGEALAAGPGQLDRLRPERRRVGRMCLRHRELLSEDRRPQYPDVQ